MASRPNTRGLTVRPTNTRSFSNSKIQNENLGRPPLAIKGGTANFLRDTTNKVLGLKRKADDAPEDEKATKKRSAFGDITNAIEKKINDGKKAATQKGKLVRTASTKSLGNVTRPNAKGKFQPKVATISENVSKGPVKLQKNIPLKQDAKSKDNQEEQTSIKQQTKLNGKQELEVSFCDSVPSSQDTIFSSQESNKTDLDDSAAYITASEGRYNCTKASLPVVLVESCSVPVSVRPCVPLVENIEPALPEGVDDYDKEMESDPFAVSVYAQDIFTYYKEREKTFPVEKYIDRQPDVSRTMRAILVDWMVEVQESFELNHETLYLAVKIMDLYLAKTKITRELLQLIGSTAMFIACKFDERTPPYVDDFLYICDDAYKRKELISMEIKILKVIGFDLGIPLSYRFLRRFARCAKVSMEDLTLTRYILEMSLMDYDLIDASDSALAAAALALARVIKGEDPWNSTLKYYSGYSLDDVYHLIHLLHHMITQPPKDQLKTIRNKYSHKVFFEVAKTPIPETLKI